MADLDVNKLKVTELKYGQVLFLKLHAVRSTYGHV
jgi:hypothetical protein